MPKVTSVRRRGPDYKNKPEEHQALVEQFRDIDKNKAFNDFKGRIEVIQALTNTAIKVTKVLAKIESKSTNGESGPKLIRFKRKVTYDMLVKSGTKKSRIGSVLKTLGVSIRQATIPKNTTIRKSDLKEILGYTKEQTEILKIMYKVKGKKAKRGERAPIVYTYGEATTRFIKSQGFVKDFDLSNTAKDGIFINTTLQQLLTHRLQELTSDTETSKQREKRKTAGHQRELRGKSTTELGKKYRFTPDEFANYLTSVPKYTKRILSFKVNENLKIEPVFSKDEENSKSETFAEIINRIEYQKKFVFEYVNSMVEKEKPSTTKDKKLMELAKTTSDRILEIIDTHKRKKYKYMKDWEIVRRNKYRGGVPAKFDILEFINTTPTIFASILSLDRDKMLTATDNVVEDVKNDQKTVKKTLVKLKEEGQEQTEEQEEVEEEDNTSSSSGSESD